MKLKTNFYEIDRDHDIIIDLLKKINIKDFPERDVKESFHYLFELYYECQDHFTREENLMKNSSYPDKDKHISSHNDCIAKFDLYLNIIQNIDPDESKLYILEGVSDMLYDWIIPHIHFEDKLLASHLLASQKSIWFGVKEKIKISSLRVHFHLHFFEKNKSSNHLSTKSYFQIAARVPEHLYRCPI